MTKLYSIVYRTGGTQNCKWTRVLDAYPLDRAKEKASEIERMGYRTVMHDTDTLRALGLPIGWEPESVDWVNDHIVVDSHQTHHIRGL